MSLKYKIIYWIRDKIPSSTRFWRAYGIYREYVVRSRERNFTITDEEKKEIRDFYSKYTKHVEYSTHKVFYNVTGLRDYRIIPGPLYYYYIDPYFSDYDLLLAVEDKNYYDVWLTDFRRPQTVARRIGMEYYDDQYHLIREEDAMKLIADDLQHSGELIVKPSLHSGSGQGIKFLTKGDKLEGFFDSYDKEDYIVQHVIRQHPDMAKMHSDSINTIRIATFLWHGEVRVLSSVVRIGVGDKRLDNFHQGGIGVGIKEDGHLRDFGFDQYSNRVTVHPQGFVLGDGIIPNYDKVVAKVTEAAKRFPHYKIINWDIAIDEAGEPVFIEFNLAFGGLDIFQYCNGPFFGDITEEVLDEVFGKDGKK